jgi:hypothetical protein
MILNISAHATLDLTALGKPAATTCAATLTYGHLGAPEKVRVVVDGVTSEVINGLMGGGLGDSLAGQAITIADDHGRRVQSRLEALTLVEPLAQQVALSFVLGESTITDQADETPISIWNFRLSNVHLNTGDEKVERPLPRVDVPVGTKLLRGWSLSKIRFTIEGREWELTDDFFTLSREARKAQAKEAVVSGTLRTAARHGDDRGTIARIAENICYLLTMALSRDIKITMVLALDSEERIISGITTPYFIHPSGRGEASPVDNYDGGVLRSFIELAYLTFAKDREWWAKTIGLFLESRVTPYIEVRSTVLNVMLDRVTTKVVGDVAGPQIDAEIPKILKQKGFRDELRSVLEKLSPNWTDARTEAVINRVRELNARPPFGKKVAVACETLGVAAPRYEGNDPRHALLHEGELVTSAGNFEYWRDLDSLMVQMLLRMVGYDGVFYHFKYGGGSVQLADVRKTPVDE